MMRAPDRGIDYRRRQLVKTMRGHTLSGRAIRRLRGRAGIPEGLASLKRENKTADRPPLTQHQFAGD
jgi:hypothetical protein